MRIRSHCHQDTSLGNTDDMPTQVYSADMHDDVLEDADSTQV